MYKSISCCIDYNTYQASKKRIKSKFTDVSFAIVNSNYLSPVWNNAGLQLIRAYKRKHRIIWLVEQYPCIDLHHSYIRVPQNILSWVLCYLHALICISIRLQWTRSATGRRTMHRYQIRSVCFVYLFVTNGLCYV